MIVGIKRFGKGLEINQNLTAIFPTYPYCLEKFILRTIDILNRTESQSQLQKDLRLNLIVHIKNELSSYTKITCPKKTISTQNIAHYGHKQEKSENSDDSTRVRRSICNYAGSINSGLQSGIIIQLFNQS